jgi:hypothetical protein
MNKKSIFKTSIELSALILMGGCSQGVKTEALPTNCDQIKNWRVEAVNIQPKKTEYCLPKSGPDSSFVLQLPDDVISATATTIVPIGNSKVSGYFQNGNGSALATSNESPLKIISANGAWRDYSHDLKKESTVVLSTRFDPTHKWGTSAIGGNYEPKKRP